MLTARVTAGFMRLLPGVWITALLRDSTKVERSTVYRNLCSENHHKLKFQDKIMLLRSEMFNVSSENASDDSCCHCNCCCCTPPDTCRRTEWPVKWVCTTCSTSQNWGTRMHYRGYYLPWVSVTYTRTVCSQWYCCLFCYYKHVIKYIHISFMCNWQSSSLIFV